MSRERFWITQERAIQLQVLLQVETPPLSGTQVKQTMAPPAEEWATKTGMATSTRGTKQTGHPQLRHNPVNTLTVPP